MFHSEISRGMSPYPVVSWHSSLPNTHQNGELSSADGILGLLFLEAANTRFSPKPIFKPRLQVYHCNAPISQDKFYVSAAFLTVAARYLTRKNFFFLKEVYSGLWFKGIILSWQRRQDRKQERHEGRRRRLATLYQHLGSKEGKGLTGPIVSALREQSVNLKRDWAIHSEDQFPALLPPTRLHLLKAQHVFQIETSVGELVFNLLILWGTFTFNSRYKYYTKSVLILVDDVSVILEEQSSLFSIVLFLIHWGYI